MYQILLCDDEKETCAELEEMILAYAKKKKLKIETGIFYTGETLLHYLTEHPEITILFLDIELPEQNGVEIGRILREKLDRQELILVYISWKQQYAMSLFQNRPFDFLVKPLQTEQVEKVLDKIFHLTGQEKYCFSYQTQKGVRRIAYREILYLKSEGRKIHLMTEKDEQIFYGKLSEAEKQLPEQLFLSIHKSYLVNICYIKEYTQEWVKMTNGDQLTISKTKRMETRRKILERMKDDLFS